MKDKIKTFRVDSQEDKQICTSAKKNNMTVTDYIRDKVLKDKNDNDNSRSEKESQIYLLTNSMIIEYINIKKNIKDENYSNIDLYKTEALYKEMLHLLRN